MASTTSVAATPDGWWFFLVATSVKLLLIPSYHSTDFEVHRHWLALTSSLPLSRWYSDASSQWTLDYPPLFAYFELLLSYPAAAIDSTIVHLRDGRDYSAPSVVLFQRLSVAIADLLLLFASIRLARRRPRARGLIFVLVLWSPALLIVDHIHFQYNGFLLGILLLSLGLMEEGRDLEGGVMFAVLICFKHLFAVAAPVYFVYILRHYCRGGIWKVLKRFTAIGMAVMLVVGVTFGPFLYHGQMQQVLQRLFPFGRGLCHAYWAPNAWVFYIVLDKALSLLLKVLHFNIQPPMASFTGGLVGDSPSFSVLPEVTPSMSLLLVVLAMLPCLIQAWKAPSPKHITRWVAYAYTCGFMFGWHVHEKASLHFLIPLGIVAADSFEDAKHYFLLAIVSCYSMFPLLFEAKEYLVKVLLLATHSVLMWSALSSLFSRGKTFEKGTNKKDTSSSVGQRSIVGLVGVCYLFCLLGTEIWGQFLHRRVFGDRLPFLPLMLTSISCAVGMTYSWIWQLLRISGIRL